VVLEQFVSGLKPQTQAVQTLNRRTSPLLFTVNYRRTENKNNTLCMHAATMCFACHTQYCSNITPVYHSTKITSAILQQNSSKQSAQIRRSGILCKWKTPS